MITKADPIKRPHKLYGHDGPEPFMKQLAAEGVDFGELLSTCIRSPADAGVLLAGSLAEGVGNEASDVDFLVLLDSRDSLNIGGDALELKAGRAHEALLYRKGVEINFEIYVRQDVERLMEAFVAMAPALYDATEVKRLPMLQPYDLRFLHRLRTGWPVHGLKQIDVWRDEFMVEALKTYLTVLYINQYDEYLEDAMAMARDMPFGSAFVGRRCVEAVLLSLLAHFGFTGQSTKWLLHWCDKAQMAQPGGLIPEGVNLLLCEARLLDSMKYLQQVTAFGERVLEEIRTDPEVRRATDFLHSHLAYTSFAVPPVTQ